MLSHAMDALDDRNTDPSTPALDGEAVYRRPLGRHAPGVNATMPYAV